MIIREKADHTHLSFGKLSDPGTVEKSPICTDDQNIRCFTSANFQYIVNHIADMYGYAHGVISAEVERRDIGLELHPGAALPDLITFRFTMNAQINTYLRTSVYGKHFMYDAARKFGYPAVFGIVAHEVGHLVTHHALNELSARIQLGRPALFVTRTVHPYWDELCADYLAGVTLAKAVPVLSAEPVQQMLRDTPKGESHPDGFWRVQAIELGYQWGKNNPAALTDAVLSTVERQKELLTSFQKVFYEKVYLATDFGTRFFHASLKPDMMEDSRMFVGYL